MPIDGLTLAISLCSDATRHPGTDEDGHWEDDLGFMSYKSLGDLRMTCERIFNNLFLGLCKFTVYRDL